MASMIRATCPLESFRMGGIAVPPRKLFWDLTKRGCPQRVKRATTARGPRVGSQAGQRRRTQDPLPQGFPGSNPGPRIGFNPFQWSSSTLTRTEPGLSSIRGVVPDQGDCLRLQITISSSNDFIYYRPGTQG